MGPPASGTRLTGESVLVLVVVLAVSRVPASVVHIVDMIPVWDRDMATPLTVDMVMMLVHRVAGWLTFVVMILVLSMKVTVMHVVDVIPVWDRDMAASFAVCMIMFNVLVVGCAGHCFSPPYRILTHKLLAHLNFSDGCCTAPASNVTSPGPILKGTPTSSAVLHRPDEGFL